VEEEMEVPEMWSSVLLVPTALGTTVLLVHSALGTTVLLVPPALRTTELSLVEKREHEGTSRDAEGTT